MSNESTINIKISTKELNLSIEEAKEFYIELQKIFDSSQTPVKTPYNYKDIIETFDKLCKRSDNIYYKSGPFT